jgi:hypothetical protein
VAFRLGGDKRVRSIAFDRLRPIDLYQETFPERLASMLASELSEIRTSTLRVSAALFSWGEAAHAALPSRV